MFKKLIQARLSKIIGGGLGALFAAIGGVTTIGVLQPAVEKASDYGAKAVELYCELPAVDRARFRAEVEERLAAAGFVGQISVRCPAD